MALGLLIAGCGSRTPQVGTAPEDELAGRTFLSVKVNGPDVPAGLADSAEVSLTFHDDGRLSANAGCNTTQGPADLSDGTVRMSELGTTEMGCPGRQDRDDWLVGLLGNEPRWKYADDRLTLRDGETTVVLADREIVRPDRPLEGTTWQVDGTFDGETASSPRGADRARLTFEDGTVSGTTGCNGLRGSAKVSGDGIAFSDVIATKKGCSGMLAELERDVLAVLDGTVDHEITSDQLRLTHSSGVGLDLVASPGR